MRIRRLLIVAILLANIVSCTAPSTDTQTTKPPDITTSEVSATESAVPEIKEGFYENDVFSFSIPEGWGLTQSQGDHYDLNTKKNITIHNDSDAKKSVAFFTISSAPMAEAETLQSLFDGAYQKGPDIENAVMTPFKRDALSGIDITYGRPWGEPRWIIRDIWLANGGVFYILTFQSYPDTYEKYNQTFDAILDSFSFKQSQVVISEVPEATELPKAITTAFAVPPATARIAFAAKGWTVPRSGEEIFVMNTDGTGITPLSNSQGDDRDPAWSPDGKHLTFTTDRDGNTEVYLMKADGTGQTRLTNSPENEYHPEWSPDGKRIIFSRTLEEKTSDLFSINMDGSGISQLTSTPEVREAYPDWSPDGTEIVFSAFGGDHSGIYIMSSDGTNVRSIRQGALHFPEWSPDGQYIAFDGEPGGCLFEVYVMKADGSEMRKVTTHPGGCGEYNKSPSWSPDGKQLVYSSTNRNPSPGVDIYIINVDGSGETALTHGKTDLHNGGFYPSWSPAP